MFTEICLFMWRSSCSDTCMEKYGLHHDLSSTNRWVSVALVSIHAAWWSPMNIGRSFLILWFGVICLMVSWFSYLLHQSIWIANGSCLPFQDHSVRDRPESHILEGCRCWSVRTILTNTTLMSKQLARFGVANFDDNCVAVFDLDWKEEILEKRWIHKKSGVQCWREGANLEDEIRWQSNKMDGIGGWVIQFVQPWRSKAYSRSIIFVCTTLHGLGSMPNTGEPT